jgi:hypothetical protein
MRPGEKLKKVDPQKIQDADGFVGRAVPRKTKHRQLMLAIPVRCPLLLQ